MEDFGLPLWSFMASPLAQYVRNLTVTVPVEKWGQLQTYPHKLGNGEGQGYTPNITHVTSAYVTIGERKYAIAAKTVAVIAVDAMHINYVVGDKPQGECLQQALSTTVGTPSSLTFEVLARFAHSQEIGTAALGDETIGVLTEGLVPVELAALATLTQQRACVLSLVKPLEDTDQKEAI